MNEYRLEDIYVGLAEHFQVTVSEEMMDMFCRITGDLNPLHRNEAYAREKNFKGKVVYGMLTSSFYSTLAGIYLPGKYSLLQQVDSKMLSPVYVGDTLTVEGRICEKHDELRMLRIKASITNQNNHKVAKAVLQVGMI